MKKTPSKGYEPPPSKKSTLNSGASKTSSQDIIKGMQAERFELESENQQLRSIQHELEIARNRYQDLFDYAPVGYVVIDSSGKITEINHMAATLIDHQKDDISGKSFYAFIVPECQASFKEYLNTVFQSGDRHICELTLRKTSGNQLQAQLLSKRFEKQNQGFVCQISIIDITRRKKFQNELERLIRERTHELIQSEQRVRRLAIKLMEAREIERKRISKELHDGTGAALTAVQFALERKLSEIGEAPCEKKTCVEDIMDMVNTIADEVRRISRNLYPSVLEDLGIEAAIRAFARQFQKLYGNIQIEQEIDLPAAEKLPDYLNFLMYRIIQESLNNTAKHSNADTIRLSLKQDDRLLSLIIKDNGQGFDHDENVDYGGLGLQSMKERTQHFDGKFKIMSSPGQGTCIRAEWIIPA